jgi:hypothetical protein
MTKLFELAQVTQVTQTLTLTLTLTLNLPTRITLFYSRPQLVLKESALTGAYGGGAPGTIGGPPAIIGAPTRNKIQFNCSATFTRSNTLI